MGFKNIINDSNSLYLCILSAVIVLLFIKVIQFYLRIRNYPKGPLPLPIIGNLLMFRGTKSHPAQTFIDLKKRYGPLYTFWMGGTPFVFIFDLDLAKEAFSKNAFSGRLQSHGAKLVNNERGNDVLFCDYGPTWENLRKVVHSAVRKYAVSDKLAELTCDVVEDTFKTMVKKEGIGNSFDPLIYIRFSALNIIASSALGKRYTIDDEEFLFINRMNTEFQELGGKLALIQVFPIMQIPLVSTLRKLEKINAEYTTFIRNNFDAHLNDYENGIIRDFADALIYAKEEAINEGKESAQYLKDSNLALALWDLFIAGRFNMITLHWMMLIMANDPDLQKRLRKEVKQNIGDRIPIQDDKNSCHFINAFISETLRFRSPAPMGIPHKAIVDTQIEGCKIPKDTIVLVHQDSIHNDSKYWSEPEVFNPDRFLENEKYMTSRPPAFIPFGIGRRICPGERLALADLFLVLVRFLQVTSDYEISLPDGPNSADFEPDPHAIAMGTFPKPYKIIVNKTK